MDFLTFPPDYWGGPRHNRHYFCEALSKQNRVLFASPPFYLVDLINKIGSAKLPKSGVKPINNNLVTYIPSKLLFTNYRFPMLHNLMRKQRIRTIRNLMKQQGMESPILLMWHPNYADMIGNFNEKLVVYYVYDNLSGYIGGDDTRKSQAEIDLLEKADVTFVLSNELYKENKNYSGNIFLLPNAVDYDLFSTARLESTTIPEELEKIPGPRIGYIGTINEKVDLDILEHIADSRPDWSIVLIGRDNYQVATEKERFYRFLDKNNVYRFDYREFSTIPSYIKGLDICLMCYVINDWTFYGDPSKMHEYLASGKPTLATNLPAIEEFSDVIDIPKTKECWIKAIDKGLNEQDDIMKNKRIKVAEENSYQSRVHYATKVIEDALTKKGITR